MFLFNNFLFCFSCNQVPFFCYSTIYLIKNKVPGFRIVIQEQIAANYEVKITKMPAGGLNVCLLSIL